MIRGSEDIIKQLEEKWNLVSMQLDWKLEPLYIYSEPLEVPANAPEQPILNPGLATTPESQPSQPSIAESQPLNTPEPQD